MIVVDTVAANVDHGVDGAAAAQFGELEVHPFAPHKDGYPEVLAITHDADAPGRENGWHSDVTWRLDPSLGSVLRMIDGPEVGGDTLFADMEAAYAGLSDEVKERIVRQLESKKRRSRKKAMRARPREDD